MSKRDYQMIYIVKRESDQEGVVLEKAFTFKGDAISYIKAQELLQENWLDEKDEYLKSKYSYDKVELR